MKKRRIGPVLPVLGLLFLLETATGSAPPERVSARTAGATRQALIKAYGNLPLSFEPNRGQSDSRVKFQARGPGYALFLASTEAVLVIPPRSAHQPVAIRMQLVGANASPRIVGLEQLASRTNYLRGNDPAKWQTAVPQYARVRYESVYPGVDLVYYGNQGQLEHDFLIAPGTHPGVITLKFEGAEKLEIDGRGDLVLHVRGGQVRLPKPHIHQSAGTRIAGGYVLKDKHEVGFEVGPYDHDKPLVIDPVLMYSTHLGGGTLADFFNRSAIAVDAYGSAYVTGGALAFPTTTGAFQTVSNGDDEVFVAKLAPDGSSLVYATFIGGGSYDLGFGIAVDADGLAYVTGATFSTDFPTTPGAFQRTNGCTGSNCAGDAFVAKLNADGSALVYSTYLGGSAGDNGYGIAIDGGGSAYVTGYAASSNFPVTPGTYRTSVDGPFLAKLNAAGSGLVYSTFVGGGNGVAVDGAGNAYVAGWNDGCVNKLNSAASVLVYSTCLGGSQGVSIRDLALDAAGNAYVTGSTRSTDFPVTPDAVQTAMQGPFPQGAFVSKLDAMGSLVYSTFLAAFDPIVNTSNSWGSGIAVDGSGHVYVTGRGAVPVVDPFQVFNRNDGDAFVAELNPAVAGPAGLVFSTALGGGRTDEGHDIAVDPSGNIYVSGRTRSGNFPLVDPLQSTLGGGFVAKIAPTTSHADLAVAMTSAPRPAMVGGDITYTITVTNTGPDAAASVDVIDSLPSDGYATLGAYGANQGSCAQHVDNGLERPVTCRLGALPAGGEATVTLVLRPEISSTFRNRVTVRSNVSDPSPGDNSAFIDTPAIGFTPVCSEFTCHFGAAGVPPDAVFTYTWDFGDGTTGSGLRAIRTYAAAGSYAVTLTVTDNDGGTGTQTQTVTVPSEPPQWWFTSACVELACAFSGPSSADPDGPIMVYRWDFGDGTWDWGPTASHTYTVSDLYWVTLDVFDDQGGFIASHSHGVYVMGNAPPMASLTATCSGLTCSFDGSSSSDSGGTIASYAWAFGDGTTGSGPAASHIYAVAGAYTVTLTVTDNGGAIDIATLAVTANAPPIALFTSACISLTCTFDASASSDSDGTITSYAWTFGDATAGSGATVSHTYAATGTHTVTLTVTDNGAATSTHAQSVAAVSQNVVTRIAHDQCGPDLNVWDVACDIHVLLNGTYDLRVPGGVGPKWSPDGSKIAFTGSSYYYANPSFGLDEILVVNLVDGSVANLTNHPARDVSPAWSRDGRKIAFVSDRDGVTDLYVIDNDGSNPTRLTNNIGFTGNFGWSPDGGRIAFASDRDGSPELYVMAADGSNPTRVTYAMGFREQLVWSPDGGRIAFACEVENGRDICTINADGTNFIRLTNDPGYDSEPAFSPVDDRIVFTTGAGEIAVIDAHGVVSLVGAAGSQPVWSPDGKRLAFVGTTTSWLGRCYLDEGAHPADDFCMAVPDIYVINVDGTGLTLIANGGGIDWFTPPRGRPMATFTPDCTGSTCDFDASGSLDSDGTITSYVWQFGDGTSGSGAIASHTYAPGGRYRVMLTVTDDTGATGMLIMHVDANAPPVASFTVACVGPTCTFDASGSSDPDGTIQSYSFGFGDGGGASLPHATHTYATGTFSVGLYVVDDGGAWDIAQQTVSVVNAPPVPSFMHSCYGLSCTFDGSGSSDPDGTITRYSWLFGDGTTGSGATVNRTYAAGGAYTVTLTVTDNADATNQTFSVVDVNAPPIASFTSACGGLTCSFNAAASSDPDGMIASYAWTFGDGTTGSGATVNRTYAAGGAYTVTLTVTDNADATNQTFSVVNVNAPPLASFTSACIGLACSFNASGSSDPDGTIASYAWTFGDGSAASGQTVAHTYSAYGSYIITLTVADNAGATGSGAHGVTVVPRPYVTFTNPLGGASNVPRDAFVSADVSVPNGGIDPRTLTPQSVYFTRSLDSAIIPAVLNTSGGGDVIVLRPESVLASNTDYTFVVTEQLKDIVGAAFLPFSMSFTTGTTAGAGDTSVAFEQIQIPAAIAPAENYTSVTIGPDGKLYAGAINGRIYRFTINADGTLSDRQLIESLQIANQGPRFLLGLEFDPSSTAGNLILYASHSIFAFSGAPDWGGKISRLTGLDLETVVDLVVNLPRSTRDHVTNQMDFGPDGALYFLQGSNTAMGGPDSAWDFREERLLNAAVLRLDVAAITSTLDVKTEDGGTYDPFAPGAPLTIYASGVRNAFDLVWHRNGHLYVPTNGSASGGSTPATPAPFSPPYVPRIDAAQNGPYVGPAIPGIAVVTQTMNDYLFDIAKGGYFGHPNPKRHEYVLNGGNPTSNGDPAQVNEYPQGVLPDRNWRGFAFDFGQHYSPDGVTEYKSGAFGGALTGKLLVVRYSGGDDILVLTPGADGRIIKSQSGIVGLTGFIDPLDITEDPTTGNLYLAEHGGGRLFLLRPILPPEPPSNLSAAAVSSSQINLAWVDNSTNETGFTVERSANGIDFTQIAAPGAGATTYQDGGLAPSTPYTYRVRAYNIAGSSAPSPTATATTQAGPPPPPMGTGLKGEYFNNRDLTNLRKTRIDATVNFNWGSGSPDPSIGSSTFSVRWSGQVVPAYTETYTFYTTSDDGVRLWVNGTRIINNWTDHSAKEDIGTIALIANQPVSIVMEYYDNTGAAVAQLRWSSPRQAKQIIPQIRLVPSPSP